eukprot:scaffold139009_cov29-Tisochrysis_lutea.AAC.3
MMVVVVTACTVVEKNVQTVSSLLVMAGGGGALGLGWYQMEANDLATRPAIDLAHAARARGIFG